MFSYINIDLPEAKRYYDLISLEQDLCSCLHWCKKLVKLIERVTSNHQPESEYFECIVTFVFVKYGRCFKGGIRNPTAKDLSSQIPEDKIKFHKLALDIRDKHIAHSVNEFEQQRVRVWLNPKELGRKVNDVNIESHVLLAPNSSFFKQLSDLIASHLAWIKAAQKEESNRLKNIIMENYTIDALYESNPINPPGIQIKNAGIKRRNPH